MKRKRFIQQVALALGAVTFSDNFFAPVSRHHRLIVNLKNPKRFTSFFTEFTAVNIGKGRRRQMAGIDMNLVYKADEYISEYRGKHPEISKANVDDKTLFFDKIYDNLEPYEQRLHHNFYIDCDSLRKLNILKERAESNPEINFAQIDTYKRHTYIPNDPLYSTLWGLARINCSQAWDFTEGDDIIVAVVDSGTDITHPDLAANLWTGPNGNHGFNLLDYRRFYDITPSSVHGTHVAGTIAALSNNNVGVVGVAPKSKILTLKALPNGTDITMANAIYYAIKSNAKVINNSWGPIGREETNHLVAEVIDIAAEKNIAVVFAAGNDSDDVRYYAPANHPRVIAVGATNTVDRRASFSNYGDLISVSAPGENILSLQAGNRGYTSLSGTSMAAPHVAGLAALLIKLRPSLTFEQLKTFITKNADAILTDKPLGSGRINAQRVVQDLIVTTPLSVHLKITGNLHDHDSLSSDENCPFTYDFDKQLYPNNQLNTDQFDIPKCDDEVWARFNLTYSMDLQKNFSIAGTVTLYDDDDFQGSQTFNAVVNFGADKLAAKGSASDRENEDSMTYEIFVRNI
jgi:hypothetical protein